MSDMWLAKKIHYVLIKHGKYILLLIFDDQKNRTILKIGTIRVIVFKNSGDNSIMERFFFFFWGLKMNKRNWKLLNELNLLPDFFRKVPSLQLYLYMTTRKMCSVG